MVTRATRQTGGAARQYQLPRHADAATTHRADEHSNTRRPRSARADDRRSGNTSVHCAIAHTARRAWRRPSLQPAPNATTRARRRPRSAARAPDGARATTRVEAPLEEACSQAEPGSASCVQRFDDSLNSAIRTTYRISLRSSSLREPRYPSARVVFIRCELTSRLPPTRRPESTGRRDDDKGRTDAARRAPTDRRGPAQRTRAPTAIADGARDAAPAVPTRRRSAMRAALLKSRARQASTRGGDERAPTTESPARAPPPRAASFARV